MGPQPQHLQAKEPEQPGTVNHTELQVAWSVVRFKPSGLPETRSTELERAPETGAS